MDTLHTYPIPVDSVAAKEINREAVLVVPERGKAEVLNEVGSFIWSLVDGKRSIEEIVQVLCANYAVEEGVARKDAILFLQNLADKGAIIFKLEPK